MIYKKYLFIFLTVLLLTLGCSFATDVDLNLTVDYEYTSDSINPTIFVNEVDDTPVYFNKTVNGNKNNLKFKTNATEANKVFNVTVKAPGYKDYSDLLKTTNTGGKLTGEYNIKLFAENHYKLGMDIVKEADTVSGGFKNYDKVLVLTTAGFVDFKGESTNVAADAVINYFAQKYPEKKISLGEGNLFLLRERANGHLNFYFILQKGDKLSAISFEDGKTTPTQVGGKSIANVREDMSREEWTTLDNTLGERAFTVASIANAWAKTGKNKVDRDLLASAAAHGHVCIGTISGYAMSQTLLKHYPPGDFSTQHPTEKASYLVIGVPGESEDDALMHFLDATPGKSSYVGINTTSSGANDRMAGFLVWYGADCTGDLIIMSFNKDGLREKFTKETGKVTELEFNSWLLSKLAEDPEQLVNIDYSFKGLDPYQRDYIAGNKGNNTYTRADGTKITVEPTQAHGLELDTIKSWGLPEVPQIHDTFKPTKISDDKIKKIGYDAADLAIKTYKNELGVDLGKDRTNLLVLTSAGFVKLNNTDTTAAIIGLEDKLGVRLTRTSLGQVHKAFWKPLWYAFMLEDPNGEDIHTIHMYFNTTQGKLILNEFNNSGKHMMNVGMKQLDDQEYCDAMSDSFNPDGFGAVHPITTAWSYDPPYSMFLTYLYHNHVCPGVSPAYGITEHIFKEFPLDSESQKYIYMGSNIYCKDDGLIYRLGVSPGLGTYYDKRTPGNLLKDEDGTIEGVLFVWDDKTNTGTANIIVYQAPKFNLKDAKTRTGQRAMQIAGYVELSNGLSSKFITEDLKVTTRLSKPINAKNLEHILSGSNDDVLGYIKSLPNILPVDEPSDPVSPTDPVPNPNTGVVTNGSSSTDTRNPNIAHSIGTSTSSESAPRATVGASMEASESAPAESAPKASAYEIEKTPAKEQSDNSAALTVLAILIILGLAGVGFWFYSTRRRE